MPLKSPSQKASKADTAEKVREIKQRQQNWLKQRSSSIQAQPARSTSQPASKGGELKTLSAPVTPAAGPTFTPLSGGTKDGTCHPNTSPISPNQGDTALTPAPNKGFQNWLQVRQEGQGQVVNEEHYKQGSDANGTHYLSRIHNRSLSPEMFDALADQIASRVKKELRMNGSGSHVGGQNSLRHRSTRQDRTGSGIPTRELNHSTGLESHHCHLCAKVMLPPSNPPMLLIPCGHTYCEPCLEVSSSCPGCQTAIRSVTANVMLQQIICEYRQRRLVERAANTANSAATYRRTRPDVGRDKVEAGHDYEEEYQTLEVRRDVLESEAETIREKMADIDQAGERCKQQISHIEMESQRVQEQMAELLQRQRDLQAHQRDYENQNEVLNDTWREESEKLKMVNATLRTLARDMDKIRMLRD